MPLTLDERIEHYRRRGWCPVPWRHQADRVRAAIRAARMVPQMKGCFANSARVVLRQDVLPLTYCEGWVTSSLPIPIEHAWVEDGDGVRHDLTLPVEDVRPLIWWRIPTPALRDALVWRGRFGPIDEAGFRQTHRAAFAALGLLTPQAE